ncbi:plastocyanin [Leptolyngbya sp. AN03gr2]|uniref:plastocyanin n=1 Tax=unclassified Leptolyngbya TaxID=2650499 RepID=UPI003D323A37
MKSIASAIRGLSLAFCAVLLMMGSLFLAAAPASADTVNVKMGGAKGLVFEPAVVTVKPGDTVHFEVGQLPPHNVIFDAAKVPGGNADLAASLSHKGLEGAKKSFDVTIPADAPAGDYTYYCLPHRGAGMVGKLVVAG